MKVAIIGDIHGTNKFLDCYDNIIKQDNDIKKIIVLGDHFDPYTHIPVETMINRYQKFIECCKKDDRIISILGNHDLESYVIYGSTNRTERNMENHQIISENIKSFLSESYLVYKIGNWLFSHAGVSKDWLLRIENINKEYPNMIMSNTKGYSYRELSDMCGFYSGDFSGYGNHTKQGCTWIRPLALIDSFPEEYNQVIAHTRFDNIINLKDNFKDMTNDLWVVDNCGKSEYLILNIEENE